MPSAKYDLEGALESISDYIEYRNKFIKERESPLAKEGNLGKERICSSEKIQEYFSDRV